MSTSTQHLEDYAASSGKERQLVWLTPEIKTAIKLSAIVHKEKMSEHTERLIRLGLEALRNSAI